jgi:hypothetical protein
MYQVIGNEELYIIEIGIGQCLTDKHIYTLYVDGERPIYHNEHPIFFFNINDAEKALDMANCGARKLCTIPKQLDSIYDYYLILQMLEDTSQKNTPDAMLLDCLNLLEDYCFDTMDVWTDLKKEHDQRAKTTSRYELNPNEIVYKVPIVPTDDIKDEYDFFRKIFSAARYFFTDTDIDQHFINEGYGRDELVKAIKYLIGHIVISSIYV